MRGRPAPQPRCQPGGLSGAQPGQRRRPPGRSPRPPSSRQAFRHRCTVRAVTRKLAAISAVSSPAANRPAVSSRSRSRRSRPLAVSPPPDAYLTGKALPSIAAPDDPAH